MTGHIRVVAVLILLVCRATAAPPQVSRITVPGLQTGAATTLIIEGTDLTPNPRIVLPVPILAQTVKEPTTANRVQIEVKLAANVLPAVCFLRLANDKGISNPVSVEIDALPQQLLGAQVAVVPVALHGTLGGSATLSTTLTGKKGQRLVIEVEARRLGSAIEPVVKLLDARRVQLGWAQGDNHLAGDTRLIAMLPADGTYTIELHDAQYRAGNPNRFRLKLGDLPYADLALPLAGQRGTKASFRLIGSVPEATRVEADLTTAPPGSYVQLPGAAPRILVSDIPEVIEAEQLPGKLQELTVPVGINGRLAKAGEEDRYRLRVQPGTKLKFDVRAERAGSHLDGVLVLQNEAGTQLTRSDDQPGTLDPGLEYTVPPGVTALVAVVSDLHGRGGPLFIYRLAVTLTGQPDFSLALAEDRLQVPRSGAAVTRIKATRAGYTGAIKLTLPGLPDGILITGDEIPAGATDTLLSLTVKDGAKPAAGVVRHVIGTSADPKVSLQRIALMPELPNTRIPSWLRSEVAVGVMETAAIAIAWETVNDRLPIGMSSLAKVKVTRAADAKGTIRLTLLTNQVVPKTKDNRMDDVNRALRLEGMPTVPGILSLAELKLVVPADLPAMAYDVAVKAEMLAADGRTVLATATTPARRLTAAK